MEANRLISGNYLEIAAVFCDDYTIDPTIFEFYVPVLNRLIQSGNTPAVGDQVIVPGTDPQKIINVCYNTRFKIEEGPTLLIYEFQIDFPNGVEETYFDLFEKELPEQYNPSGSGNYQGDFYLFMIKSYYGFSENLISRSFDKKTDERFEFGRLRKKEEFEIYMKAIDQFNKNAEG